LGDTRTRAALPRIRKVEALEGMGWRRER